MTSIWVIKRSGVEEAGAIVGKYIPSLGGNFMVPQFSRSGMEEAAI